MLQSPTQFFFDIQQTSRQSNRLFRNRLLEKRFRRLIQLDVDHIRKAGMRAVVFFRTGVPCNNAETDRFDVVQLQIRQAEYVPPRPLSGTNLFPILHRTQIKPVVSDKLSLDHRLLDAIIVRSGPYERDLTRLRQLVVALLRIDDFGNRLHIRDNVQRIEGRFVRKVVRIDKPERPRAGQIALEREPPHQPPVGLFFRDGHLRLPNHADRFLHGTIR